MGGLFIMLGQSSFLWASFWGMSYAQYLILQKWEEGFDVDNKLCWKVSLRTGAKLGAQRAYNKLIVLCEFT